MRIGRLGQSSRRAKGNSQEAVKHLGRRCQRSMFFYDHAGEISDYYCLDSAIISWMSIRHVRGILSSNAEGDLVERSTLLFIPS